MFQPNRYVPLMSFLTYCLYCTFALSSELPPIDRYDLVNRHNPSLNEANALSPFSVGNGGFAFTADITGLQTFPDYHAEGTPLGTLSEWGWDSPMLAMTAARVGEPELAIQSLLMDTPKNKFLPNGHCYHRENLPTYLPANGGLLTAIAMMAGGWDDCPEEHAPGFPKDGQWTVRWENLKPMP